MQNIAVVIPTHSNFECLIRCLESFHDLTETQNEIAYRFIVVDNASNDYTPNYLKEQQAKGYPLTILHSETNLGFVGGTNWGLQQVRADEHALLLNDDTQIVDPLWLVKLASHFKNPTIGAVGPVTNYAMGLQNISFSHVLYTVHPARFLIGFCLLVRAEALRDVGLLDPRFENVMNDDLDYALRLHAAGYELVTDRRVFVMHYGSQTHLRDVSSFAARETEGRNRLIEKWGAEKVNALFEMEQMP